MGLITVSQSPFFFIIIICFFAGPPSVNFEGPQAILRAIGPRTRLILTPGNVIYGKARVNVGAVGIQQAEFL